MANLFRGYEILDVNGLVRQNIRPDDVRRRFFLRSIRSFFSLDLRWLRKFGQCLRTHSLPDEKSQSRYGDSFGFGQTFWRKSSFEHFNEKNSRRRFSVFLLQFGLIDLLKSLGYERNYQNDFQFFDQSDAQVVSKRRKASEELKKFNDELKRAKEGDFRRFKGISFDSTSKKNDWSISTKIWLRTTFSSTSTLWKRINAKSIAFTEFVRYSRRKRQNSSTCSSN